MEQDPFTLEEKFLTAFLDMSCSIRGNRMLERLSFNEMIICNMLIKAKRLGQPIYASQICEQTRLYKSQTTRILTSLERKGIIVRTPCPEDKRRQLISLVEDQMSHYSEDHHQVMTVIAHIRDTLGPQRLAELASLMEAATLAAQEKMPK